MLAVAMDILDSGLFQWLGCLARHWTTVLVATQGHDYVVRLECGFLGYRGTVSLSNTLYLTYEVQLL